MLSDNATDTEEESEDEIDRQKRENMKYVSSSDYSDDGDDVEVDAETAVFIPRIRWANTESMRNWSLKHSFQISRQTESEAVDVLRRAQDQYRSQFQDSILI